MIEFALLMLPFFILIFGIFDVGLLIWGGLELDNATSEAARLVRTGQAQSDNYDANRCSTVKRSCGWMCAPSPISPA